MQIAIPQPIPGETLEAHFLRFDNEDQASQAKEQIQTALAQALPHQPVEVDLPTGERLVLTPSERWFLEQMLGVNIFLLLFSGMR